MRAAVIGCGRIGSTLADDPLLRGDIFTHAEAYTKCPRTELVALCDTDGRRLAAGGSRWNVKALFTDPGQMMASAAPEMVSICTPTASHLDVVRAILTSDKSPRAILCEKPLGKTVHEAEEIVSIATARHVSLSTIYMRRFAKNFIALKSLIDSGELGEIQGISGWYVGGTFHNGTHWFDMLRYFAGEVEMVSGLDILREGGDDPTFDVALFMSKRVLATLRAGDAGRYSVFEMDIMLEKGRAQITDSGHVISLSRAAPSPRYTGYVELEPFGRDLGDRRDLMLHAVEDAVGAVNFGREPACSGADGIAAMRIADAASISAREFSGGVVKVEVE
jgi:predicted dehydrogenase